MKKLRIGIFPHSLNLSHPADRRRIVAWAQNRGHNLVIGESRKVDLMFISEGSDFLKVSKIKGPPKIFDLIDGYLAPQHLVTDTLRGYTKSIIRQHKTYPRSYTSIVRETCQNVDLIVCSTPEQLETILPYNSNVRVILDNHSEFPFRNFSLTNRVKSHLLFWEGTSYTLSGLEKLWNSISESNLGLNIVTDLFHPRLLGRYLVQDVENRLAKNLKDKRFELFEWSIHNVIIQSSNSKVAVVPVNTRNKLQIMKPENRLLIMFRLGLPCLTSAIPSYERVERTLQTKITCTEVEDWKTSISQLLTDEDYAAYQVSKGQNYIREFHTEEILFNKWDYVVGSLV